MLDVKKTLTKVLQSLNIKHGKITVNVTNDSVVYNDVYRVGSLGLVKFGLNGASGLTQNSWTKCGTLPSGYAPSSNSELATFVGGAYGFAVVRTDGCIYIQKSISTAKVLFRVVIPITYE